MTCELAALCIAAGDPHRAAGFWAGLLGRRSVAGPAGAVLLPPVEPPVRPRSGPNRLHLDLAAPSGGSQAAEVARLVSLGATRTGTGHDGGVTLTDPEGNELCLLPPPG